MLFRSEYELRLDGKGRVVIVDWVDFVEGEKFSDGVGVMLISLSPGQPAVRKLLDFPEPLGDFLAFVPGSRKQQSYPSTVSYLARLVLHRYAMLALLDESGAPVKRMGVMETPATDGAPVLQGAKCPECGAHTLIRKDGCDWCTTCGYTGVCG